MKLYRLRVTDERMVAPDAEALREKWIDQAAIDGEAFITVEELAEPEATLHLTRRDVALLVSSVSSRINEERILVNEGRVQELARLKTKLDGLTWQLAAQRTMLEKAQEPAQ